MLGGADNPNGELLSYIIGADTEVITLTTLTRKYEGSTCLPNVALYAAGYRKSKQLTAR